MPGDKKFDLGDYIEVKERIKIFYELYAQGRLVTGEVRLSNEPDGVPRVLVQGLAYRTPDDTLPGVGWSWMVLPGTTSYTRGSELENAETSAWGRAIASLGILIDRSIASANEVQNKQADIPVESADPAPVNGEQEEMLGRVSRRGIIRKGTADAYKLTPSKGPEGWQFGFRLEIDGDKNIPQVVIAGALGNALFLFMAEKPEKLLGTVAKVSGLLYNVRGSKGSWYRLHVDRFENEDVILPAPADEPPGQVADKDTLASYGAANEGLLEPPEDVPLLAEAPTAPLFDDVA